MLKQPQYQPRAIWQMYSSLLAASSGCFDKVPVNKINLTVDSLFREIETNHQSIIKQIADGVEADESNQKKILEISQKIAASYVDHVKPMESK